jgi:hypothetical protein
MDASRVVVEPPDDESEPEQSTQRARREDEGQQGEDDPSGTGYGRGRSGRTCCKTAGTHWGILPSLRSGIVTDGGGRGKAVAFDGSDPTGLFGLARRVLRLVPGPFPSDPRDQ